MLASEMLLFVNKSKCLDMKCDPTPTFALAFVMRTDDPTKWRLSFEYQVPTERTKKQEVMVAWYVGDKHYHQRIALDRYMDITIVELHSMIRLVVLANESHACYDKLTKAVPVALKDSIKSMLTDG
jgi:hypothetical protein